MFHQVFVIPLKSLIIFCLRLRTPTMFSSHMGYQSSEVTKMCLN